MRIFLMVIHVISCTVLIDVILLQHDDPSDQPGDAEQPPVGRAEDKPRHMGNQRPTKPMTPQKETTTAVAHEETKSRRAL
ncbi:preprotein translocase subunit SecG, partial [Acetomicrobium sp. S15 = DSM 107314]|uniref:preprotein translocase subunit SecG n=1 Tax=Acetomicrobium sp. S15 = DSM 107314 TaxID=2529858 RepID=UPI001E5A8168